MKLEFEFDTPEGTLPIEGVAVLYCYTAGGETIVAHGTFSSPTALSAIGLFTLGLECAKGEMLLADEIEES